MLCVTLRGRTRTCGGVSGGLSDMAIFDPFDFNFTQATVAGVKGAYSAVALRGGSGGAATASLTGGAVGAINVTNGGLNYQSAPTVVFTGGGGTGATATATIANGVITGVVVGNGGTGYTTAPAISFTGGGASSAAGAKMFVINFQADEGEWTWKQSTKNCSVKYEHEIVAQLPQNNQGLTNFLESIDAAGCCCGLGVALRLNSGEIFVAGERYVNNTAITKFIIRNDGSEGGTGKVLDDFNGANLHLKGAYGRNLYEYSGTWADFEALT